MSLWNRLGGGTADIGRLAAAARSIQQPVRNAGQYQPLFKYLRERFANRVVLTFGEIEDLLGFALPEQARVEQEWWTAAGAAAARPSQSDSWTLASRTAVVNLAARSVVFDRDADAPRSEAR